GPSVREAAEVQTMPWLALDAAAIALFILLLGFIQAGRQPSVIAVVGYLAGRLLLQCLMSGVLPIASTIPSQNCIAASSLVLARAVPEPSALPAGTPPRNRRTPRW